MFFGCMKETFVGTAASKGRALVIHSCNCSGWNVILRSRKLEAITKSVNRKVASWKEKNHKQDIVWYDTCQCKARCANGKKKWNRRWCSQDCIYMLLSGTQGCLLLLGRLWLLGAMWELYVCSWYEQAMNCPSWAGEGRPTQKPCVWGGTALLVESKAKEVISEGLQWHKGLEGVGKQQDVGHGEEWHLMKTHWRWWDAGQRTLGRKSQSPGTDVFSWGLTTAAQKSAEPPRERPKPCRRQWWEEDQLTRVQKMFALPAGCWGGSGGCWGGHSLGWDTHS